MEIRTATMQDCRAIAAIASAFRNHLGRALPLDSTLRDSISRLLGAADADFLLAMDGDVAVGYVLQRYRFSMWANGTEATIEDLYVDPGARKSGTGMALIQHALQVAHRRSCTTVCLDTNENNAASTKIYSRLGFNAVSSRWNGRQIFYRLNLQDAAAATI